MKHRLLFCIGTFTLWSEQVMALRFMAEDRVITSQEQRFMEGSDWVLALFGLAMFAGLGLLQFGLPHWLMLGLKRYRPAWSRHTVTTLSLALFLTIWLGSAQLSFHRYADAHEHLLYLVFAAAGYGLCLFPFYISHYIRRRWPQLTRAISWCSGLLVLVILSSFALQILRFITGD